jgi:hypothetical protein
MGSSETIRRIPHLTREIAILIGLLFTDGCVSPKSKHSWRIYFSCTSEALIASFRDAMLGSFDLDPSRVRIGLTTDGLIKAVVDSKEIGNLLVSTFGTFRTLKFSDGILPPTKLPVKLLLKSGFTRDFLRAAFSCDGGVSFYTARRAGSQGGTQWLIRTVFLSCAHPNLRAHYQELLLSLGIRARDVPGDEKLKIEREEDIRLFADSIGFIPGVHVTRHSRFWYNQEKNAVLNLLIQSYGNPSAIYRLPKFNEVMR